MKLRLPPAIGLLSLVFALNAPAADYWWDGGTTNIGGNGNGTSTFNSGTWSTSIANWDQGAGLVYASWPTSGTNSAIFGGASGGGNATVTLGTNVTVSQILINPTGSYGYSSFTGGIVTFNGSYNTSTPTISTVNATSPALTFASQITGNLSASGGLVLALGGNPSTFDGNGRFFLSNNANDFIGDITITSGYFAFTLGPTVANSRMGNAANKIILNGGAVTAFGGDVALSSRQIEVGVNGGAIATGAANSSYTYAGAITGGGTLSRYHSGGFDTSLSLDGSLSGYTGNLTNHNGTTIINSTSASGGQWTVTGGTLKFGASNKIVGGPASKGNVTVNGGVLDLNGTTQSLNGLAGSGGTVSSSVAGAVTLTVGSGDASASYAGVIANGHASAVVSLTKTGSGTQTLTGVNTYTGGTLVSAGTLVVNGTTAASSGTSISAGATLQGTGRISVLSGAGLVSPGNSPGILTATQVNGSGGLDFAFEMTQFGSPAYNNATASGNDVLHLTGGTPFTASLTSANVITVDFSNLSLAVGQIYKGGFYASVDFLSSIQNANFQYAGANGATFAVSTFQETANFATGTVVGGWVTQFEVLAIPEASASLLLMGGLIGALSLRCRKKSKKTATA